MLKNFNQLIDLVKEKPKKRVVVAAAQTSSAIEAAILAKRENLADSLLVGDKGYIESFLSEKYPVLGEVRGMGLLNGVEVVGKEVAPLLHSLRNNGLLAIRAGTSVLRLAPPLVVSDEEISLALQIIDRTIAEAK